MPDRDSSGRFIVGHNFTPLGHKRGLGYKHTEEMKKHLSEYAKSIGRIPVSQKGVVRTEEQKLKISISRKGKYTGEDNDKWKGDAVGYTALHRWVIKRYGKPVRCEFCGGTNNMELASKNYKYTRNREDWLHLCHLCHQKYDRKNGWGITTKKFPSIRSKNAKEL